MTQMTEPDGKDMKSYRGLNLRYVRELLQQPPHYGSADDAQRAARARLNGHLFVGEPCLGAIAYYDSSQNGNIALAVGNGLVLTLKGGVPALRHFDDVTIGTYKGWTWTLGADHLGNSALDVLDPDGRALADDKHQEARIQRERPAPAAAHRKPSLFARLLRRTS